MIKVACRPNRGTFRANNLCDRKVVLLMIILACHVTFARGQNITTRPEAKPVASLADSLKRINDAQLHIFYVHGMADPGSGYSDSQALRKSICKFLKDCTSAEGEFDGREYADEDKFVLDASTPSLSYLDKQIWKSRQGGSPSEGWNASAPFVDHWKLVRNRAKAIYVDEINWWPLVFAVKCRQIIAEDAALAGPSVKYIDSCSSLKPDVTHPGRFLSYQWIDESDVQKLKALPVRGALINRNLKNDVLDWGFTDAMLAVSEMRPYLLEGIRQLVRKSVHVAADGSRGKGVLPASNQEFVIVSHSLGSYLIFSALDVPESDTGSTRPWKQEFEAILSRTSIVYFFANQLRLLELANLDNSTGTNMIEHLETWGRLRGMYQSSSDDSARSNSRPQLIAWSDPSDLLSWNVPELNTVQVRNRYVKNSIHWLWLFESPTNAHGNYDTNKRVVGGMLKQTRRNQTP
jgi:hypothetical protein